MNWASSMWRIIWVLLLVLRSADVWSQGGNTCITSEANPISLPFFTNNQTLCGDGNDYTGTNGCLSASGFSNPYGGQDWFYTVIPAQDGLLFVRLNDIHASGQANPVLSVYEGCPGTGTCLSSVQGNNSGAVTIIPVIAGVVYFIALDALMINNFYANCYQYDLTVNLTPIVVQPACSNMGFEDGNLNSWLCTTGKSVTAPAGSPTPTYQTTNIGVVNGRHTITTGGTDPCGGFPQVDPLGGSRSVMIGNNNTGAEAEMISQTFLVGASNSSFTYRYAVVFEDPGHTSAEQPFFIARLRNDQGDVIPCSEFIVSAAASLPGFFNSTTCTGVRYKPWSTVNVDLSNYMGQSVTVEFTVGDCSQGGHFGYAYVDASCSPSTLAALADTICPGQSVTLIAPSGYASFAWQPGNITTQSITVSPAVTTIYTLNLTAFNGCVTNAQVPITVAPIPVPVIQYQAPACDLPVQVQSLSTISSGIIASQQWTFGGSALPSASSQSTVNVTYPGPGSYPISLQLVSDQGCTASATQTVIVPPCVFRIAITGDTICPGQCLTFPVSKAYGTPPYSYLWSNGSNDSTITLCSNVSQQVSLTVTDADGFIASDTAMITVVPDIYFQPIITHVSCSGQANGSIDPGVQGWGPFSYGWDDGNATAIDTGLSAGIYVVHLVDNFGCLADTSFNITEPAPITTTLSIQPATCNQNNGTITVNAPTGGTSPYEYAIDGGVYSTLSQFNSLAIGTHTISVRDANGCLFQVNGSITMLSYPTQLMMSLTDATCGEDNGVVAPLQVIGGIGPFQIWVNGSDMGVVPVPVTFDSLPAGPFNVELTDVNGCIIDTNVTLQQINGPGSLQYTVQPASCGLNNAIVTLGTINGGTPAFEYSFNGSPFSNQTTYQQQAIGIVTLIVRDQNQCVLDTLIDITLIPDVALTAQVIQNAQCFNGSDGQAVATIQAGTAPFTFLWTNSETDSLASSLAAGTWDVYVTDALNCRDTAQVVITQPALLTLQISYQNPHCAVSNGIIQADTAFGGTTPYQYQLNGGALQQADMFTQLDVGSYTLQIVDAHGCTSARQAQLAMPSYPTFMTLQSQDAVCSQANGNARLMGVQGGIAPFQVQWIDSSFTTITDYPVIRSDLDAGNYPLIVRDANGCMIDSVVVLQQFPGPDQMQITVDSSTCDLANGQLAILQVNGGSPAYQYSFNGGAFGSQVIYTNLAPDFYSVQVRDANGCLLDSVMTIAAIPNVQIAPFITHPITCFGFSDGALQADVQAGTLPYAITWLNGPNGASLDSIPAGTYQVSVTDGNGCVQTSSIVLTQPDPVVIDVTGPSYVCENDEAHLIAQASGGTSHIEVTWPAFNFQGDTLVDTPTATRTYSAVATDVLGCAATDSQQVTLRLRPQGNITTDVAEGCSPICVNFEVNSTGSAAIQSFNWSFSNGSQGVNAIQKICFTESGLQDVSVDLTDEFGCTATLSAPGAVTVYGLPDARFSYNPDNADIQNPQYQFINESTLASTYLWTFGDGQTSTLESPLHTFPDTGHFTACLRVTTSHGCVDQICKMVEIDPFPTIFAPNAFTPNGDGNNEVFMIRVTYATKFLLEIFDRWGELIYEGTDPLEGWDGTYMGNRVQEDVYVWRATITNTEHIAKQMIGRVTLID